MTQIYGKLFKNNVFSQTHTKIIELVGSNKIVLELGSSTGYMTKRFQENNCKIDIIEKDIEDFKNAIKYANKGYCKSLDDYLFLAKLVGKYDLVIAADVLEHLIDPEKTLKLLKKNLKPNGSIFISLPNIASWQMRKALFFKGKFQYQDSGLLDKTHLRFYTYYSIQELVKSIGFKIKTIYPTEIQYPFSEFILSIKIFELGVRLDKRIRDWISRKYPNLAIFHFILEVCND